MPRLDKFHRDKIKPLRGVLFALFFVSGFCGLLYQVVWTRMAFASFGIITPVLSVVISVFMLGLALGSWAGGSWVARLKELTGTSAIIFYGGVELVIAIGAFAVPKLFGLGEHLLLSSGETDSVRYLTLSALVLFFSILPWCFFMGATFPLMMAFIREQDPKNSRSFSFLYVANVLGAMSGAVLTGLVLIELFGFHKTLRFAAAGNFFIALVSFWLGKKRGPAPRPMKQGKPNRQDRSPAEPDNPRGLINAILFSTGFSAMAMEVVWARAFTPVLTTQVYSFALIVFTYLGATFFGSLWYRLDLRRGRSRSLGDLISLSAVAALIPVLVNDPRFVRMHWTGRFDWPSVLLVLLSICPLCAALGYLTPALIDKYSGGRPADAGRAYALNVLGCILGPLFASYVLLPWCNEGNSLAILAAPFFLFYLLLAKRLPLPRRVIYGTAAFAALAAALFFSRTFTEFLLNREKIISVRRDYAASVISSGAGFRRRLMVNGIGMTVLAPETKFMSHLPLAFHKDKVESVLVICFGMGTSYRSALSWNIDTTVVELVPSVTKAFGFYHDNAAVVLANPLGHVVIDDGRRYLKRTDARYDVMIIDPPPPIEAAGSSLLYSDEFYELAKQHLKPGGILQAWYPGGPGPWREAVARSLHDSFPYIRCFASVKHLGFHFLASIQPIEELTSTQLIARMPEAARRDLLEWSSSVSPSAYLGQVVWNEQPVPEFLNANPAIRITDDRPFNEYFLMRRLGFR